MRVAVRQPNYAPWCGYFAKLFSCESSTPSAAMSGAPG